MDDREEGLAQSPPVWAVFGDLMSGLVGVFVLLLVWFMGYQLELTQTLRDEVARRQVEEQRRILAEQRRLAAEQQRMAEEKRRMALEAALADPLTSGRVTLRDGRIGISGSVLFSLNSDQLQVEGQELLSSLVAPLLHYLRQRDEWLMISGFTDDLPIQKGNSRYEDNWELSAQRALTVTRALIREGMPPSMVFAAAFGAEQPTVPNVDDRNRAMNRRVEMTPVPRTGGDASAQKNPGVP
jgi:flagellar motor protein MotB